MTQTGAFLNEDVFTFVFTNECEEDHSPESAVSGSFTPLIAARRIENPRKGDAASLSQHSWQELRSPRKGQAESVMALCAKRLRSLYGGKAAYSLRTPALEAV